MWGDVTVDLYLRERPPHFGYMIVAGVQEVIDAVTTLRCSADDLDCIPSQSMYDTLGATFFDSLRHFQFAGDIWARPEGTPGFAYEPILRVAAPLPQIGLFERLVTHIIGCTMAVATNSARSTATARGRSVLDFGSRRIPGLGIAKAAARAAFIGGCAGTNHALAARHCGIPAVELISATMLAADEDVAIAHDALSSHFPEGCHRSSLTIPTWKV